ncbi:endo-1,6-beta-D-glucanase [Magnaporthiopsis poae ATCC 64411]|uniref:Endo-1,6-beta-D-glucanase n=1 Tax=Magnaporthiopsis poae (strain ATCC 64411 / 73-15) TaxID=644358 RepID=A0A0C4DKB5_MAGP6|nr:endo-1,6-beta-D-glucanase [Magnaporthiopsis poae ATCC 64411]
MRFSALLLAALASAAAPPSQRKNRTAEAFASSADGQLRFTKVDAPVFGGSTNWSNPEWRLFIYDSEKGFRQKVKGFGGTVADVTVDAYNTLPPASRAELLRLLMTPDGANFSLIRHSIGSSDLSAAPAYTYADNGGKPDPTLESFDLGDRGCRMVSMLQDMKRLQPSMFLVGTPWAPPAWMQSDKNLTSTLNKTLDYQYSAQFADYFTKYLKAYNNSGVKVDAISIQNEPVHNEPGTPGISISADDATSLIRDRIVPSILNSGLRTQIWINDQNTDQITYARKVLNGTGFAATAVAWHCYAPQENWTTLSTFQAASVDTEQYMTDCWTSDLYTKWNQASWFTLGPLRNWASGSIARVLGTYSVGGPRLDLAGSCESCTGLFTVDAARGTFELRPDYYMLGQYSRYIPGGAVILRDNGSATEGAQASGIESVASMNPDGTRAVVVENRFSHRMRVVLSTQSGELWTGDVTPQSVTTWLLPSV